MRDATSRSVDVGARVAVTLCVLLWPRESRAADLIEYEDHVLRLVPLHGGSVLHRARTDGSGDQPLEVHTLEFPSEEALQAYMGDERRTALAADRDRAIARTDVLRVELI
jgi:uncharacterized protein (DUF1330 family)